MQINALAYTGVTPGTSDCTAAVQALLDYCQSIDAVAYFPPGRYTINGVLQYKCPIIGDKGTASAPFTTGTRFQTTRTNGTNIIELPIDCNWWYVENITFIGVAISASSATAIGSSAAVKALAYTNSDRVNYHYRIKDCIFRLCYRGVDVVGFMGLLDNCNFQFTHQGFTGYDSNAVTFLGGEWNGDGGAGSYDVRIHGGLSATGNITFVGTTFESTNDIGVDICEQVHNVQFLGCHFENNLKPIRVGALSYNGGAKNGGHYYSARNIYINSRIGVPSGLVVVELDNVTGVTFGPGAQLQGHVSKTELTRNVTNIPTKTYEYSNSYSNSYEADSNGAGAVVTEPATSTFRTQQVVNIFPNPHFEGGPRGFTHIHSSGTHGANNTFDFYLQEETSITRNGSTALKYTRWKNVLGTYHRSYWRFPNQQFLLNKLKAHRLCFSLWWYCPSSNPSGTDRSLSIGVAYTNAGGSEVASLVVEYPKIVDGWNRIVRWLDIPSTGTNAPHATAPNFAVYVAPCAGNGTTTPSTVNVINYFDDLLVCIDPANMQDVIAGHYVPYPITAYDASGNGLIEISGSAAPSSAVNRARVGDRVINSTPVASGTIGWVCTTAGAPGTWKTYGVISS